MRRSIPRSGLGKLAAVFSALSATATQAYTFDSLPSPNLDLSALGRVAVVGDFDSISVAQYQEQSQSGFSTNGSQSLLARYPDGAFASLAASDGIIQAMCPFVTSDGTFEGVVVGGNFTSLGGIQAQGVALFNPNTSVITPLPGLSGSISSIYCDQNSSTVYFGGSFTGANSTNAIAWVTGWTNLPFAGFNGPVNSVTKAPNGNMVFAGDFDGLGNVSTPTGDNLQIINIGAGNITSSGGSNLTGFSDPSNIVCKNFTAQGSGLTWLLEDDTAGYWDAKLGFGFNPTTLRMYNTDYEGRGTKTFRLIALPLNGIMNLTYTDSSGVLQSCTADCPLTQGNLTVQEFTFVNSVGMNEIRVEFIDWYGDGAGLNGIELLETDLYSFAIPDFNAPSCDGSGYAANATSTGPWKYTPSGTSDSDYLTAAIDSGTITASTAYVVFQPDIMESGNYTIEMYTPGCIGDNTCSSRGSANITGTLTSTGDSLSTIVTQTNDYDKYDQIYYGPVDVTSDTFRPTVTLSAMTGQDVPLTLVAQRIRFVLVNSTGGLNGLYEYNPSLATVTTDFSSSAIDEAGMDLAEGAVVNSMAVVDDVLYIGGNFSSGGSVANLNNIFMIGSNNATAMVNDGLNDAVDIIYANGSTLYVGGNFTSTKDGSVSNLNGVAVYSTSNKAWSALGAGVNGTVSAIVPLQVNVTSGSLQDALAISGTFSSVNAFGSNSSFTASGIAIWLLTSANWLHNVQSGMSTMQGTINAYTTVPDNSPLWAGSVSSQNMATTDAVALSGNGVPTLVALGTNLGTNDTVAQADASALLVGNYSGAVTGIFVDSGSINVTAIGGHFAANTTSGTINNFALLSGSSGSNVTGLPSTIYANSTVLSMDYKDTTLYIGGEIEGTAGTNTVGGFLIYDLSSSALASTQPPALGGDNVIVNSVVVQPSSSNVYVGGDFSQAGSLGCATLCMWSATAAQWQATGTDLSGVVTSMVWASNTKLVLAGNLTIGGNHTFVANYDSSTQTFSSFAGADSLPGPVLEITPATTDYTEFWAVGTATTNGSSYLYRYNGQSWVALGGMGSDSTIRSAQVMTTTTSHDSTSYLADDQVLLITGTIDIDGFGNSSAVLFNGTTYTPFLLANTANNGQGSISKLFVQNPGAFLSSSGSSLARGYVVLIALAIALALIFLLVVVGMLMERYRRKREGYVPMKQLSPDQQANLGRIPPESLFGSMSAKGAMAPKL